MKLKLQIKDTKILANSGIYLIEEFIRNKGIKSYIDSLLPGRAKQAYYQDSDLLLGLAYSIYSGGAYLEDLNYVRKHLSHPYLQLPSSDTIGYRARQLAVDTQTYVSRQGVEHFFNENPMLNQALGKLAVHLDPDWKHIPQTIDYDNVLVNTDRPDSRLSYRNTTAYQPGVILIDRIPVYIEGRNGNSPSRYLMHDTLQRGFQMLSESGVKIGAIRIDGAGFQHKVFSLLTQHYPEVKYYIRAERMLLEFCKGWKKVQIGEQKGEALGIPWRTPGPGHIPCRLVAWRTPKSTPQHDLFEGAYDYWLILTNDWEKSPKEVIEFYNQRGTAEQSFDIMKNDFNWRHLAFGNLKDNTVYLLLTAMAYLIYRWLLKIISRFFPALSPYSRIKRFMLYFVNVPGKWIRSARSQQLNLYTQQPYLEFFNSG